MGVYTCAHVRGKRVASKSSKGNHMTKVPPAYSRDFGMVGGRGGDREGGGFNYILPVCETKLSVFLRGNLPLSFPSSS